MTVHAPPPPAPPIGLLVELTHRCPLGCLYCSNPIALERPGNELDGETWKRVFSEAAALGALHVHLSGGEPTARRDIVDLTGHASKAGLYTNLITSGIGVSEKLTGELADCGLDHAQLSFQGADQETNDRLGHYKGSWERKRAFAGYVIKEGLPLTINAVIHRSNIHQVGAFIDLAVELGARRLEIAHTQYYGWALANRAALMPSRADVDESIAIVEAARVRLKGELVIDLVVPDYYARYPKPCAGGWGRVAINVSPTGKALPCHAAEIDSGPRILECARSFAQRHLAFESGVQNLPRHGLDARTLPVLRPARDRLGRMPLSGAGADRRRAQHRSRLPQVASSRAHRSDGDGRVRIRRRRTLALALVQEGQGRGVSARPSPRSQRVRKNARLSMGCEERSSCMDGPRCARGFERL